MMNGSGEDARAHQRLLACARALSRPLADAIELVGPISPRPSDDQGIGHFLSRAIVGQQLSAKAARAIWERVSAAASQANMRIPEFAEECTDDLRACGVSANKVKSLQSVRLAEREGMLREDHLQQMTPDEKAQRLVAIWGIGPWTCDMALIFYFRDPDVWPEGDVAVQQTFTSLLGRTEPARAAAKFSPYRSYLALSMWRVTDTRTE